MEGIFTPFITPFDGDGSIDTEAYSGVVDFLIGSGVDCIVVGGSTCE